MGLKYGKLTVIEKTNKKNKSGNYFWKCKCECGNEIITIGSSLTTENTQSCGKCPHNTFEMISEDTVKGLTLKGESFYFDKEDLKIVTQFNWHIIDQGRVQANTPKGPIRFHKLVMGFPSCEVDHKDGDGTNNRKSNLRICSHAFNMRNMKKHKDGKSRFKGVSWASHCKKWRAQIYVNGKRIHLGYFDKDEQAHEEYCKASKIYHGEYGRTG